MTSSGAYSDEMARFLKLSDEELARILAGEAGASDPLLDDAAAALDEVRRSVAAARPAAEVRARHLAALMEAARTSVGEATPLEGRTTWRRVMEVTDKMKSFALRTAAGAVAASMSMMGLAYAGVDLPGQAAERAIEAVTGVELPNQGSSGNSVAEDVKAVVESDLTGCARGRAIADAADANRKDDQGRGPKCEGAKGSKATGEEKSAEGRARAAEKSGGRSESSGDGASDAGRTKAATHSGGTSDAGGSNGGAAPDVTPPTNDGTDDAEDGADNAGTNDDAGAGQADDASGDADDKVEAGQSKNPTGAGRP